jgi:Flp pilus assembly protein TadG
MREGTMNPFEERQNKVSPNICRRYRTLALMHFKTARLMSGLGSYKRVCQCHRGEEGGSLVEMALVLPMLMLILTGIFAFGIAINNYVQLTNAVNTGGRLLSISRLNTTDPCADTVAVIKHAAPNLTPSLLQFSFVLNTTGYASNTTSCSSSSTTTGAAANLIQGDPVTITVTYPCSLGVYGKNLVPGCTLSAQVTELEQ